jgi:hypothetical protein
MDAIDKLIRAASREFGACPTWMPILQNAASEYADHTSGVREIDTALMLIEYHDQNVANYPLKAWLQDCRSYRIHVAEKEKRA